MDNPAGCPILSAAKGGDLPNAQPATPLPPPSLSLVIPRSEATWEPAASCKKTIHTPVILSEATAGRAVEGSLRSPQQQSGQPTIAPLSLKLPLPCHPRSEDVDNPAGCPILSAAKGGDLPSAQPTTPLPAPSLSLVIPRSEDVDNPAGCPILSAAKGGDSPSAQPTTPLPVPSLSLVIPRSVATWGTCCCP